MWFLIGLAVIIGGIMVAIHIQNKIIQALIVRTDILQAQLDRLQELRR